MLILGQFQKYADNLEKIRTTRVILGQFGKYKDT